LRPLSAVVCERGRQEREENPLPDVVLPDEVAPWLCRTVHLDRRDDGLQWTLTDECEHTAAMVLQGESPRGVLEVFLQMYRHLEWDEQLFPGWLREGLVDDAAPRTLN
jgi:hypothetical protein